MDPSYVQYITYEDKNKVIYAELKKALYGTVQALYLVWKNLTSFLVEKFGFTINQYDWCVDDK